MKSSSNQKLFPVPEELDRSREFNKRSNPVDTTQKKKRGRPKKSTAPLNKKENYREVQVPISIETIADCFSVIISKKKKQHRGRQHAVGVAFSMNKGKTLKENDDFLNNGRWNDHKVVRGTKGPDYSISSSQQYLKLYLRSIAEIRLVNIDTNGPYLIKLTRTIDKIFIVVFMNQFNTPKVFAKFEPLAAVGLRSFAALFHEYD
ncbi:hypothetical protein K501DRAFT_279104 [Backusella circina FSU 941]|nr:hypothetical protein K501DRAFT_279104 [Backusella circina FSU 941]